MEQDITLGIVCALVSAITFGSTYVPLKWFHKGDGLYFQWVQSMGQLLVGVAVALTSSPEPIHPIAMLSGMFYSIGNSLTVFIMDGIGLAIGYLLWNTITCVVGWAVTRFGLFSNPQLTPKNNWLNIAGVVTVCVGMFRRFLGFAQLHAFPNMFVGKIRRYAEPGKEQDEFKDEAKDVGWTTKKKDEFFPPSFVKALMLDLLP